MLHSSSSVFADYVIVGGGVCGVCMQEELNDLLDDGEVAGTSGQSIIFITGQGGKIKRIVNKKQIGSVTFSFDVEPASTDTFSVESKRTHIFQDDVIGWDPSNKTIRLKKGTNIAYGKLAIATGASPRRTLPSHPCIIRLRDTQTIKDLQMKLEDARRVMIIGNGGIASELA